MKLRNLFAILVLASSFVIASCGGKGQKPEQQAVEVTAEENEHLHYIQVAVEGMTCEGCENTVKGAIEKIDGVQMASATHVEKYAIAGYDEVTPDTTAIREAITAAGYTVTGFKFIGHDLPNKEQ